MPVRTSASEALRTADIARVLRVTPVRVRRLVRAGLCQARRRRGVYEYSFQDLVMLRAAHGLLRQRIPLRRVRGAMAELARQLPPERPLSGVRIYADGKRVTVRAGAAAWQPESGQGVLVFDVDELTRRSAVVVPANTRTSRERPAAAAAGEDAETWFDRGIGLEESDLEAARRAYRRALEIDPDFADAYVNLGRMMYESGDLQGALSQYREALRCDPVDAVTHFNMGLVQEDAGDREAARAHYARALAIDPKFADAHFNLARVLERLGRREQALRHLMAYRRLKR
jgi:tetratricopeptide (TPR) repeat protein